MRIRSIKPGFFQDDRLCDLPPLVRILFAGLWGLADAEGRLEDRVRFIKAQVLPYDDVDLDEALDQLHDAGFIARYGVRHGEAFDASPLLRIGEAVTASLGSDDRFVIAVLQFNKHQRLSGTEAQTPSQWPPPPANLAKRLKKAARSIECFVEKQPPLRQEANSASPGSSVEAVNVLEGKGREGNKDQSLPRLPAAPEAAAETPTKPRQRSAAQAFFDVFQHERCSHRRAVRETAPAAKVLNAWWERACEAVGDDAPARLEAALVAFIRDEAFRAQGWPWAIFASDGVWRSRVPPPAAKAPPCGIAGCDDPAGERCGGWDSTPLCEDHATSWSNARATAADKPAAWEAWLEKQGGKRC